MKIAIGSDHAGYRLKEEIKAHLVQKGPENEIIDCGTISEASVDYPDFAEAVAKRVASGECEKGIIVCGTGIGVSIAANKVKGIRAALCGDVFSARSSRAHNDANILCLGERVVGRGLAMMIVEEWLNTPFEGGRHERRVKKIHEIEKRESGQG